MRLKQSIQIVEIVASQSVHFSALDPNYLLLWAMRGLLDYVRCTSQVRPGIVIVTTATFQGESVRITGKSKDDLQAAIQLVKSKEDELDVPLQFENYR